MGERIDRTEAEGAIAHDPSSYEIGQEAVAFSSGIDPKRLEEDMVHEDFLDPSHPQYGTVDEHGRPIPGWLEQITVRSILLSAGIGFVFNLMVLKLGFTVGIIPSLNIAAGLIGFTGVKGLVYVANKCHLTILGRPFTRQENSIIQTTVVACYGLAFSGGFTNALVAMDWNSYLQVEGGVELYPSGEVPASAYGNPPQQLPKNVVQPSLGKYIAFMAVIYFVGIFALVPLRRLFILKYRLTYPSGTATGTIINGFHTPLGEETSKKQVKKLGKWFGISFIYSGIKWCFSGSGDSCGLDNIPSLGMRAKYWTWYSDFSQTYIGIGLLVPKHITYAIVLGAVLTWGIAWPLINERAGDWYPEKYKQPSGSLRGIYAYKVFVGLGFILGDGAYNVVKLFVITARDLYRRRRQQKTATLENDSAAILEPLNPAQREALRLRDLRDHVFLKDQIPWQYAAAMYVALAAICMGVTPHLFPGVKAYYILIAYIVAPLLGFCNAYGMGLSDWSLLTTYGKLCIVIFAAWGGNNGGIIAGLAVCTVMQTVVGCCADLMTDFKTGYLTLSSPRSMFAAQIIGAGLAVVISPAAFWLYWTGFDVGNPKGEYRAPFAPVFRGIALVSIEGSKNLPKHCLGIAGGMFGAAILIDALRDCLAHKFSPTSIWVKLVPIPSMLGIPSFIGAYFAVDMAIGGVILGIWQYFAPVDALMSAPLVASALIAGDGVWTVPSAILALAKVSPPMCAQFFRTSFYDETIAPLTES